VETSDFSIRLPLKSPACLLWQVSHFVLTETAARLWGSWQVTHATLPGFLQRHESPFGTSGMRLFSSQCGRLTGDLGWARMMSPCRHGLPVRNIARLRSIRAFLPRFCFDSDSTPGLAVAIA